MKAVNAADVLVIEDTISNFSAAHQITIAVMKKKPVLVLRLRNKNKHFKTTFMDGFKSPYLEMHEYSLENYQQIIRSFLKKYDRATDKHRFNLVIDEVERNYLEWATHKYEKSRTELIRSAIRDKVAGDKNYKGYLAAEPSQGDY